MSIDNCTYRLQHFLNSKNNSVRMRAAAATVVWTAGTQCGRQRVRFALWFYQNLVVSPRFFTSSSGFWFLSRLILHHLFKLIPVHVLSSNKHHQPSFQVCVVLKLIFLFQNRYFANPDSTRFTTFATSFSISFSLVRCTF